MRTLLVYREDGPLARWLGSRAHRVAPSLLTLAAVLPLGVAIAAGRRSDAVVAAVLVWFAVAGGLARGGPQDRFGWAVPALLRAGEYAALIWLAPAAGVALSIVLAVHHYDLVYRLRYRPPAPERLAGGWDTRVLVALVLALAGAAETGFYAGAGILGALFVAESVASWLPKNDKETPPA